MWLPNQFVVKSVTEGANYHSDGNPRDLKQGQDFRLPRNFSMVRQTYIIVMIAQDQMQRWDVV